MAIFTQQKMSKMPDGKLYMIPSALSEHSAYTPGRHELEVIHSLRLFLAERAKTARHYIATTLPPYKQQEIDVLELPKHGDDGTVKDFIKKIQSGKNGGFLSEAGCPGIADPGAEVVSQAYSAGIEVVPLVGPSSILLALMASGMSGQHFCFKGYLPQDKTKLAQVLVSMEAESARTDSTQIWIETPYRNNAMREVCLKTLKAGTRFCIAANLTGPQERIFSAKIKNWQPTKLGDLQKTPAIFLMYAGSEPTRQ